MVSPNAGPLDRALGEEFFAKNRFAHLRPRLAKTGVGGMTLEAAMFVRVREFRVAGLERQESE